MANNKEVIDGSIEIYEEVFDEDFDNVEFEPEVVDDSDEEEQIKYGY